MPAGFITHMFKTSQSMFHQQQRAVITPQIDGVLSLCRAQGPDMPVVYTWAEWLQTSALEALSYSASLPVPRIAAALQTAAAFQPEEVVDATSSSAAADPAQTAAEPGDRPWEMLLVQLLQYDASREYQLFQEACAVLPVASCLCRITAHAVLELCAYSGSLCYVMCS